MVSINNISKITNVTIKSKVVVTKLAQGKQKDYPPDFVTRVYPQS